MMYASLWSNEEFAKLSPNAKLLYLGTITFADDDGRLKGNSAILRSQVFPLQPEITVEEVRKWLNEVVRVGLVTHYKSEDKYFIQHPNWTKYQLLRSDRKKESNLPPPDVNQVATKRRHKEVSKKGREGIASSLEYLSKIPDEDIQEFVNRFDCSEKGIRSKAEDLILWCKTEGKLKKNYRMFLLKAIKKDFPERKIKTEKQVETLPAAPENEELKKSTLAGIREDLKKKGVIMKENK